MHHSYNQYYTSEYTSWFDYELTAQSHNREHILWRAFGCMRSSCSPTNWNLCHGNMDPKGVMDTVFTSVKEEVIYNDSRTKKWWLWMSYNFHCQWCTDHVVFACIIAPHVIWELESLIEPMIEEEDPLCRVVSSTVNVNIASTGMENGTLEGNAG